jgi:hypothetical protein
VRGASCVRSFIQARSGPENIRRPGQPLGEKLEQLVQERQALQAQLGQSLKDADQTRDKQQTGKTGQGSKREDAKGSKMEEFTPRDETSKLASSGVQWFAALFVFGDRRRSSG